MVYLIIHASEKSIKDCGGRLSDNCVGKACYPPYQKMRSDGNHLPYLTHLTSAPYFLDL